MRLTLVPCGKEVIDPLSNQLLRSNASSQSLPFHASLFLNGFARKFMEAPSANSSGVCNSIILLRFIQNPLFDQTCSASSLDGQRRRCSSTLFSKFQRLSTLHLKLITIFFVFQRNLHHFHWRVQPWTEKAFELPRRFIFCDVQHFLKR